MATTTLGTSPTTRRTYASVYWAVAIAVLVVAAVWAMRPRVIDTPATAYPTQTTTPDRTAPNQ